MRVDYTDGRSMNSAKWNIFANLANKEKNVYDAMASDLSLTTLTSPDVDTKTDSDALTTAPAQLGTLTAEINTGLDSLGLYDYVYDFNNATNITENETLSWYDSTMQLGTELLELNNQLSTTDSTYVSPADIVTGDLVITDTTPLYTLNGEIRYGDLSKSYETTPTSYKEYTLPSGTETVSTPLISRDNSDVSTDYNTDENWDEIFTSLLDRKATYDGTHVINYTSFITRFMWGDRLDFGDDYLVQVYASVIVDVYEPDGTLVSTNQYNRRVDPASDKLFLDGASDSGVERWNRNISVGWEFNSTIDSLNRYCFIVAMDGTIDYEWTTNQDYEYVAIGTYGMGMVVSESGIVDSDQRVLADFSAQIFLPDGTSGYVKANSDVPKPQIAQSDNGTVMVCAASIEGEAEKNVGGELDDATATSFMRTMCLAIDSSGIITKHVSGEESVSADVRPNGGISIHPQTDNITPAVYVSGWVQVEYDEDLSGADEYKTKSYLWKCGVSGITVLDNFDESRDEDTYYRSWSIKLTPDYVTNTATMHARMFRRINGVTSYYYTTSETEFNEASNTSAYIMDGRISDGVDWHGVTYTFQRPNDTPTFINFGRQRKYFSMDYGGLYDGTDGSDITSNQFTLYHSLPSTRHITYITNTEN